MAAKSTTLYPRIKQQTRLVLPYSIAFTNMHKTRTHFIHFGQKALLKACRTPNHCLAVPEQAHLRPLHQSQRDTARSISASLVHISARVP